MSRLCELHPGIFLTTEEKAREILVMYIYTHIYIYIITDKLEDKLHIFTTYMSMLTIFKTLLLSDFRNSVNRALDIAILILF